MKKANDRFTITLVCCQNPPKWKSSKLIATITKIGKNFWICMFF